MVRYAAQDEVVERTRPQLIRWGAIFGGAVLGLGLLTLLSALWLALAYGSNIASVREFTSNTIASR